MMCSPIYWVVGLFPQADHEKCAENEDAEGDPPQDPFGPMGFGWYEFHNFLLNDEWLTTH